MELLTSQEAADFMKISVHTLEKWRAQGTGPDYVRAGRQARYDRETLEAWLLSRTGKGERRKRDPLVSEAGPQEPTENDQLGDFVSAAEAAALLGRHLVTLAKWRRAGTGPAYGKRGSRVVYDRKVIEAWIRDK